MNFDIQQSLADKCIKVIGRINCENLFVNCEYFKLPFNRIVRENPTCTAVCFLRMYLLKWTLLLEVLENLRRTFLQLLKCFLYFEVQFEYSENHVINCDGILTDRMGVQNVINPSSTILLWRIIPLNVRISTIPTPRSITVGFILLCMRLYLYMCII